MKLKRLFTAILSAALTLSLCAMPAMADDTGTAGTGTTTSKTPTAIDRTKTGSLTIHKYAGDPTSSSGTRDNGESTVTGGTPLNGVTFTLYQVEGADWLKTYYQGTGTPAMPKVSDYTINSNGTVQKGSDIFTAKATVITGDKTTHSWADGTAVADNLALGLYLVVETDKPDAVKEAAKPFLVSIPMTSVVDPTSWLYDVTVNPKNATAYGDVTLKKVGYTGSEPDGTVMSGYTFKLYKWNGTEWTWITKKPQNGQDNMGTELGTSGILTTNIDGKISVEDLTKGVYAFVETEVNKTQGYILDDETAYVFKLDADGAMKTADTSDVASSATDFDGAVKTLNRNCVKPTSTGSATNNLEVINYKPDLKKTVKDRKGNPSATYDANYAIGDTVPFVLTITVPENIAKLKTFTVTDKTDKNQLLHTQDVVVTGTAVTTGVPALKATDYTITNTSDASNSSFTIDFKPTGMTDPAINKYAGGTITITYTATLQKGAAVVGDTTGDTFNKNSAELKYSSKTTVTGVPGTEDSYTIHEEAAVYTFKAGILKTDGASTALDGVKFDLYKKFDDATDEKVGIDGVKYKGATVKFLTDDDATRLGLNATKGTDVYWYLVEHDLTTDGNGKVVANGLPKGEYKFVETQTKKDYNLLTKPVDADLNIEYTTVRGSDTTYNAGTKTHSVISTTYKNKAGDDYKYEAIEVINRKGFTLPVTGGFGTLLFSGIGLLLVLVGVSVLFSLKKKTNRA